MPTDAADSKDSWAKRLPSLRRHSKGEPYTGALPEPTPSDDQEPGEGYSGQRAADIVGITYRQLDYWARTDLLVPSLVGTTGRRRYSYRDLIELKVVKRLLDAGIKLEIVREVFAFLRDTLDEDIVTANLVIQGSNTVLIQTDGELIDLVKRGQGVLNILPLAGVKEEVDARIVALRPSGRRSS